VRLEVGVLKSVFVRGRKGLFYIMDGIFGGAGKKAIVVGGFSFSRGHLHEREDREPRREEAKNTAFYVSY